MATTIIQPASPHTIANTALVSLQARAETATSALQQLCAGLKDNNASVVGDAVQQCPPEQAGDLSTALAQGAANESTCGTVAEVCSYWLTICMSL